MDIEAKRAERLKNPLWLKFKIAPSSKTPSLYALTVDYLLENDLNYSMTMRFHDSVPTTKDPKAVEVTNRLLLGKLSKGKTTLCQGFSMDPDTVIKIGTIHFSDPKTKEVLFIIDDKSFDRPRSFLKRLKSVLTDRYIP